jgi:fermentation-respiration switch protein FrsA (DUF1100 family)
VGLSSASAGPPERRRRVGRILRRWLVLLAGGYLVVCLVMWLFENRLVFQPTPASAYWVDAPTKSIEDVSLTSSAGNSIHAWWLPNKPEDPVLLLCPGNGGNLSGRGNTLVRMRERLGCSVLIFDYPGYGKSTGNPSEPACYDAGEAALAWLKNQKQVPADRVILYGESLGGGVATELATRHDCRALVLVKTFTLLPAAAKRHYPWLPVYWLMSNRFDSVSKLPRIYCPVFIASATHDSVVPFEHGELLFQAANEPKQFFRNENADHGDSLPDEFWSDLRAFLEQHSR